MEEGKPLFKGEYSLFEHKIYCLAACFFYLTLDDYFSGVDLAAISHLKGEYTRR